MEESNKLPLKRVELSLTKFNEVAIPHHLDLLRQHRVNIIKHESQGEYGRVRNEQANARRVAQQLRALLAELEALRRRVRDADLQRFDALTQRSRDRTLQAIVDYLGREGRGRRGQRCLHRVRGNRVARPRARTGARRPPAAAARRPRAGAARARGGDARLERAAERGARAARRLAARAGRRAAPAGARARRRRRGGPRRGQRAGGATAPLRRREVTRGRVGGGRRAGGRAGGRPGGAGGGPQGGRGGRAGRLGARRARRARARPPPPRPRRPRPRPRPYRPRQGQARVAAPVRLLLARRADARHTLFVSLLSILQYFNMCV